MNNLGMTIIIIILVPILFQVVLQAVRQEKRHKEILKILKGIEEKLK